MSVKPHREKAVGDAAADPKKNRVQADKDNTLKGVAERLKSVKPHVTKKAVRNRASDPKKKTECSQGKDNTLKGVAERLKSVKPHVTKKAPRKALSKCSQILRTEPDQNGR